METLWLCLVFLMLGVYVVLDGFDLGAGIIHFGVARTPPQRRLVLRTIGPVWDGNEVWLLAAGGTLFMAFPAVYAAAFSGFYLPLMILLWLLILRGLSVELRSHIEHPLWLKLWDVVFSLASGLIAIILGAALGNLVRGVPLNDQGFFFEPLWTNFLVGDDPGILDWYTVPVGLTAFFTVALHGAIWVALKTTGEVHDRSKQLALRLWPAVVLLALLVTVASFVVQPQVAANLARYPWGLVFPGLSVVGLGLLLLFLKRERYLAALLASSTYILGMLTSAVFGIYPYLLPARTAPAELSLSIQNSKAADYGLWIALLWWGIGMTLATIYFVFVYRMFRGKVTLEEEGY
jgi:cytochrome d ubiquinol oxidase subunit II